MGGFPIQSKRYSWVCPVQSESQCRFEGAPSSFHNQHLWITHHVIKEEVEQTTHIDQQLEVPHWEWHFTPQYRPPGPQCPREAYQKCTQLHSHYQMFPWGANYCLFHTFSAMATSTLEQTPHAILPNLSTSAFSSPQVALSPFTPIVQVDLQMS